MLCTDHWANFKRIVNNTQHYMDDKEAEISSSLFNNIENFLSVTKELFRKTDYYQNNLSK